MHCRLKHIRFRCDVDVSSQRWYQFMFSSLLNPLLYTKNSHLRCIKYLRKIHMNGRYFGKLNWLKLVVLGRNAKKRNCIHFSSMHNSQSTNNFKVNQVNISAILWHLPRKVIHHISWFYTLPSFREEKNAHPNTSNISHLYSNLKLTFQFKIYLICIFFIYSFTS